MFFSSSLTDHLKMTYATYIRYTFTRKKINVVSYDCSCESQKKLSSVCLMWMDKVEVWRDEERDGCPICWHSDPAGLWEGSGCLMSLSYPRELTPLLPLESLI